MSENTKNMICPFCDEELRHGVKVCRGCQAEISYGNTNGTGWCAIFFIALAYVLFGTDMLGSGFTEKLTSGKFWGFLVLDIILLFATIALAKDDTAHFERRHLR